MSDKVAEIPQEIWKDIPNYEGLYKASTFGSIINFSGKVILFNITSKGRQLIRLHKNNNVYTSHVGRVIGLTFIPNPENKPTINHIDGNHTNNRVDNLEWATYKENLDHAKRMGINNFNGQLNPMSILSEKQVLEIKKLLEEKPPLKKLAIRFGVSYGTIYAIDRELGWKYLWNLNNHNL